jgi:hypothetical protein
MNLLVVIVVIQNILSPSQLHVNFFLNLITMFPFPTCLRFNHYIRTLHSLGYVSRTCVL